MNCLEVDTGKRLVKRQTDNTNKSAASIHVVRQAKAVDIEFLEDIACDVKLLLSLR